MAAGVGAGRPEAAAGEARLVAAAAEGTLQQPWLVSSTPASPQDSRTSAYLLI